MPTWLIKIEGIVQGVGFRPRVYRLAQDMGIAGEVSNGAEGLRVRFNADEVTAKQFYQTLLQAPPYQAVITSSQLLPTDKQFFEEFEIVESKATGKRRFRLTPDYALCDDCRIELKEEGNLRQDYTFITCTQCGPRYSIITDLPYDRPFTTMADFAMCPDCQREYGDPTDRRHFSQTNSCPTCGISLKFYDAEGTVMEGLDAAPILNTVVSRWEAGEIIAIKGIGGYLLTCDARSEQAVKTLRERKQRPFKPLAVMYPSLEHLKGFSLSDPQQKALTSSEAPIVLLPMPVPSELAPSVAPELRELGVMLPYAPLFELLLDKWQGPIVATSGNLSHAPIAHQPAEGEALLHIADAVLTHNRPIVVPQDDSVVRFAPGSHQRILLRRSRGIAPNYFPQQPQAARYLFAAGADLKASLGLWHEDQLYLSQYLGDLTHYDVQVNYGRIAQHLMEVVHARPTAVLHDLHTGYHSTRLAKEWAAKQSVPTHGYQHHEAHFAAVLGEHDLLEAQEPVLGVIWDGTGYGHDGQIWGGEFFRFEAKEMRRVAQLAYFPIIAGDRMAREPRLSALSILPGETVQQAQFSAMEAQLYQRLIEKANLHTSSMGRLFDAVASVLHIRQQQTYEGEAAMILEAQAAAFLQTGKTEAYELAFPAFAPQQLLRYILEDRQRGKCRGEIAARFHLTLVAWVASVARQQQTRRIAFSGGIFQNALLIDLLIEGLGSGYQLYFHQQLSPNDENIAFGQMMLYAMRSE